MSKIKKFLKSALLLIWLWPVLVLADNTPGITNPIQAASFMELLNAILKVIVELGTPILIIAFIWVGFMFISARGNSSKITVAKEALFYTMLGAAVVIGSQAIAVIIQNTVTSLK